MRIVFDSILTRIIHEFTTEHSRVGRSGVPLPLLELDVRISRIQLSWELQLKLSVTFLMFYIAINIRDPVS